MTIEAKIEKNIALADYSTFKIGGPAKYFIEVKSKNEIKAALVWAKEKKEDYYILGGASNILISDSGYNGLVIKLGHDSVVSRGNRLYCDAAAKLVGAARLATGKKLSGLEWAYGIPQATVGGAVRGNAGAFGVVMKDIIETVEALNIKKKRFELYSNKDCKFEYRGSVFKKNNNYLIWSVTFKLNNGSIGDINNKIEKVLNFRNTNQPKLPSAGCVFKNLSPDILKKENIALYQELTAKVNFRDGNIGAGVLIDMAGLKGKTIGGAKVSLEHANFIVNTGKATAEDVVMLISFIKQQIRDKFSVQLQEEIGYLGF